MIWLVFLLFFTLKYVSVVGYSYQSVVDTGQLTVNHNSSYCSFCVLGGNIKIK